jgi:hypothetical protein
VSFEATFTVSISAKEYVPPVTFDNSTSIESEVPTPAAAVKPKVTFCEELEPVRVTPAAESILDQATAAVESRFEKVVTPEDLNPLIVPAPLAFTCQVSTLVTVGV